MSRIDEVFDRLRGLGSKALIPFVVGGYPTIDACEELIVGLDENGADIIEIGLAHSDPLADGPTIQRAYQFTLSSGVTTADVLAMAGRVSKKIVAPLVIMAYYNLIFRFGLERFAVQAKEAGVCGVIIPDLPVEEASAWRDLARENGIDTIFLISPTSPGERIELIEEACSGFIYCLSLTGVTGARSSLSADLPDFLTRVRNKTKKPLAVGFGISGPDSARLAAKFADGVIVGSGLLDLIDPSGIEYGKIYGFTKAMKAAIES